MNGTECDGVLFFEGIPEGFTRGMKISTQLDGFFSNTQMASLRDVKQAMASFCKSNGGEVIIDFKYGQRALGFFASIFSRDNVVWYGEGCIGLNSVTNVKGLYA